MAVLLHLPAVHLHLLLPLAAVHLLLLQHLRAVHLLQLLRAVVSNRTVVVCVVAVAQTAAVALLQLHLAAVAQVAAAAPYRTVAAKWFPVVAAVAVMQCRMPQFKVAKRSSNTAHPLKLLQLQLLLLAMHQPLLLAMLLPHLLAMLLPRLVQMLLLLLLQHQAYSPLWIIPKTKFTAFRRNICSACLFWWRLFSMLVSCRDRLTVSQPQRYAGKKRWFPPNRCLP